MKRIVSLLLCFVMIFATAGILSSCSKGGNSDPKVDKKIVEVDLTGYSIVVSSELTNTALTQVNNMSTSLRTLTGTNVRVQHDAEAEEVETEDLEILVGQTLRVETTKTLSGIKGHGWAIRVFDNKIVIVGTTPFLTSVALSYFLEHYVQDAAIEKTVMSVNQKVALSKMEMITSLADEEGNSLYSVVYDDSVDDTTENPDSYASNANPTGGVATDEIYNVASSVQGDLKKAIGAKRVPFKKASVEKSDHEILVGNMERDEYRSELEALNVKEYGIAVRNGKIMLLAWNDAILSAAYTMFQDMFKGSIIVDDDGNESYAIPANCFVKGAASNSWFIDFPKPEGADIRLDGTVDVNDNSIEYIYSGEGVNDASFEAYCDTLEEAGYSLYGTETVWGESSFRQYVDENNNVSLYVYHSAYQYAAEQKVTDVLPSIRIIATNLENNESSLPGKEILTQSAWTKITDSMITSLKHDYGNTPSGENSWGLSYVITLEDGSFVIFDGGIGRGYTDDCSYLWSVLNNLYKKTREAANMPTTPSSSDPIRVRAWVLTHEHSDHFTVFKKFLQTYGKQNFKMDYLVFNAISQSERINSNNPETAVQSNFSSMKGWVNGGFNYIKAHTGQVFYFANLKMEVLYTHEDLYPKHVEYFNNSGTVVRTTITSGSRESTCIWLGDMERNGSRRLRAMYGSTLESEMVQVAHHGGNGCEVALYELIKAKVVWFPSNSDRFNSQAAPAQAPGGVWYNKASWTACNNAAVEIVIMSDKATQTMYITEAGREADYKTMFDAKTGLPIPEESFQNYVNGIIDQRD